MNITVRTITPADAEAMLAHANPKNRQLRKHRVKRYAHDMERGRWLLSGDPIRIDDHGVIIDGHHRLHACVEAKTPIQSVVITGLSMDVYPVIDNGLARNARDVLHAAGIGKATTLVPVAKMLMVAEQGGTWFDTGAMSTITHDEVRDYVIAHLDELEWAEAYGRALNAAVGGIATAWAVAAAIAARRTSRARAEAFLDAVRDGAGLAPGDIRLALRNWLARQRGGWSTSARYINTLTYAKAFDHWHNGRVATTVRSWTHGDDTSFIAL